MAEHPTEPAQKRWTEMVQSLSPPDNLMVANLNAISINPFPVYYDKYNQEIRKARNYSLSVAGFSPVTFFSKEMLETEQGKSKAQKILKNVLHYHIDTFKANPNSELPLYTQEISMAYLLQLLHLNEQHYQDQNREAEREIPDDALRFIAGKQFGHAKKLYNRMSQKSFLKLSVPNGKILMMLTII